MRVQGHLPALYVRVQRACQSDTKQAMATTLKIDILGCVGEHEENGWTPGRLRARQLKKSPRIEERQKKRGSMYTDESHPSGVRTS